VLGIKTLAGTPDADLKRSHASHQVRRLTLDLGHIPEGDL
jgi:hypothetical protein